MSGLPPQAARIRYVMERVAKSFGMTAEDMTGPAQCEPVRTVRKIGMRVAQNLTEAGSSAIGRVFHRDHSTVIAAWKNIEGARQRGKSEWAHARIRKLTAEIASELTGPTNPQDIRIPFQSAIVFPEKRGAERAAERIVA